MAEKTTIARPYAKAAFQEARGDKRLAQWSATLHNAAAVVHDPRVHELLNSPSVSVEELAQFMIDLSGSEVDEHAKNFFRTLAENRRLAFLPGSVLLHSCKFIRRTDSACVPVRYRRAAYR